jgi:hypothetical protein
MAGLKSTGRQSHAAHFTDHLDCNERNALRVLLLTENGLADLRHALSIHTIRILSDAEYKTGCAHRGTTADLFDKHRHAVAPR